MTYQSCKGAVNGTEDIPHPERTYYVNDQFEGESTGLTIAHPFKSLAEYTTYADDNDLTGFQYLKVLGADALGAVDFSSIQGNTEIPVIDAKDSSCSSVTLIGDTRLQLAGAALYIDTITGNVVMGQTTKLVTRATTTSTTISFTQQDSDSNYIENNRCYIEIDNFDGTFNFANVTSTSNYYIDVLDMDASNVQTSLATIASGRTINIKGVIGDFHFPLPIPVLTLSANASSPLAFDADHTFASTDSFTFIVNCSDNWQNVILSTLTVEFRRNANFGDSAVTQLTVSMTPTNTISINADGRIDLTVSPTAAQATSLNGSNYDNTPIAVWVNFNMYYKNGQYNQSQAQQIGTMYPVITTQDAFTLPAITNTYYVNPNIATSGDGSFTSPFKALTDYTTYATAQSLTGFQYIKVLGSNSLGAVNFNTIQGNTEIPVIDARDSSCTAVTLIGDTRTELQFAALIIDEIDGTVIMGQDTRLIARRIATGNVISFTAQDSDSNYIRNDQCYIDIDILSGTFNFANLPTSNSFIIDYYINVKVISDTNVRTSLGTIASSTSIFLQGVIGNFHFPVAIPYINLVPGGSSPTSFASDHEFSSSDSFNFTFNCTDDWINVNTSTITVEFRRSENYGDTSVTLLSITMTPSNISGVNAEGRLTVTVTLTDAQATSLNGSNYTNTPILIFLNYTIYFKRGLANRTQKVAVGVMQPIITTQSAFTLPAQTNTYYLNPSIATSGTGTFVSPFKAISDFETAVRALSHTNPVFLHVQGANSLGNLSLGDIDNAVTKNPMTIYALESTATNIDYIPSDDNAQPNIFLQIHSVTGNVTFGDDCTLIANEMGSGTFIFTKQQTDNSYYAFNSGKIQVNRLTAGNNQRWDNAFSNVPGSGGELELYFPAEQDIHTFDGLINSIPTNYLLDIVGHLGLYQFPLPLPRITLSPTNTSPVAFDESTQFNTTDEWDFRFDIANSQNVRSFVNLQLRRYSAFGATAESDSPKTVTITSSNATQVTLNTGSVLRHDGSLRVRFTLTSAQVSTLDDADYAGTPLVVIVVLNLHHHEGEPNSEYGTLVQTIIPI